MPIIIIQSKTDNVSDIFKVITIMFVSIKKKFLYNI